jgi:myosin heavy subunit
MEIANPIYDVVFKYLMEDNEIAKLIISTIIKKQVISLDVKPTERTVELGVASLTVYRLDYTARIVTDEGPTTALIEIQKAKFPTDIMRFRHYLGEQYKNKDNAEKTTVTRWKEGKQVEEVVYTPVPLMNIYFLGYTLDHYKAPVVRIERTCYDDTTQKKLTEKEHFVECLSHDGYVIQIPFLPKKHRSDLEEMLAVFDQSKILTSNPHVLNIREEEIPEAYRPLYRRLIRAIAEPEIRDRMDIEDEVVEEFNKITREIAEIKAVIEVRDAYIEETKKALEETKKVMEDKDKVLEDKDKALEDKDKALEDKDKALEKTKEVMEVKDKALEKTKKALEDKDKALEDKDKALEETKKALEDKDKALEDKDKALEVTKKAMEDKNKALEDKDKALEEQKRVMEEQKRALEENEKLIRELSGNKS